MRLRWRRRALDGLFAIQHYIARHNPDAAGQIGKEIQSVAIRLKQFPNLGHPGERIGVLELQVPGRPYVLPYRLQNDFIEILAVFDQRRNPEKMS